MRSSRLPLRTQLLAVLLVILVLVLLVASLAGTALLRGDLMDRVDDQLAEILREGGRPEGGPARRRVEPAPTSQVVLRYDRTGRLVRRDGLAAQDPSGPRLPTQADRDLPSGAFDVASLDGDGRWRVLAVQGPAGATGLAAVPLNGVEDTVSRLLRINAAIGLLALAAGGALTWVAVRRSLRPLVAVEETAEAIASGDLTRRLPPGDPRTEVGSLSASFNAMVDRFETAFSAQQRSESAAWASEERMRRFVADAGHELRTPLTSIRGFAELFRQGAVEDPEELARVLRRIEDEAARMGLLVEDLLLLARLDQQRPLRREQVDVLALAADVVQDASAVHGRHHVVRLLPPSGPDAPVVHGDDARLRQVLGNLVTNAVAHTPDGTLVEVAVRTGDGQVHVDVRDHGNGMPPDVAARVFERFYRADESRTRAGAAATGSGLGLSIVAAIVAAHGGTVRVESEPGRGTTVRVALPAAGASSA